MNFHLYIKKKNKINFEKRQYDTFVFLKNIKSYGGKRNKTKDLNYIIEYWKLKLYFKDNKKNILTKLIIMMFKFPRIMFLYLKNYLQLVKYSLNLYKDGFKKRLQLRNRK